MKENRKALISQLIKPAIQELKAYHVADAQGFIKLDAMENPYAWSEELKQEWSTYLARAEVNRYPDPQSHNLKQSLRQTFSIADDLELLLGNGSDEIIQIIAMAVAKPGACIMAPEPGFVMYKMIARFLGLDFIGVPLNKDYELDEAAMLQAIETHQPAVIFIAYPNNPTGNLFSRQTIDNIIYSSNGLVVIDEAYQIFSSDSYINDLVKYDNVLLMRTLSKVGLAGLRLGYLVGHKGWLDEFEKIRLPYNINVLTQLSVEFFLRHYPELEKQAGLIKENRQSLFQSLSQMEGVQVYPSEANFLLLRSENNKADAIFNGLVDEKVLIKKLHGSHPSLEQCLRVTVGKTEENQTFLDSLSKLN